MCGQERDTHRRSVYNLIRDLIEDIVSFDSRILRTAAALLFEPGEIPMAFREGRTRPLHAGAATLFLRFAGIFPLILSTAGIAIVQFEVTATPIKLTRCADGNYFMANPAYDQGDPDLKKYSSRRSKFRKSAQSAPAGGLSASPRPSTSFRASAPTARS